jgi:KaiC/GvpD/RAD55 family RecA-like ATPase
MSRESEIVDLIRARIGVHAAVLLKQWEERGAGEEYRRETLKLLLLSGLVYATECVTAYGDHELLRACAGVCSKMGVPVPPDELKALIASTRRQAQYVPDWRDGAEYPVINRRPQPSEIYLGKRMDTVKTWDSSTAFEFGIEALDSEFQGVQPGEICVVSGAQGSMKTSFALGGVENALRKGFSVMFFSLDMEPGELQERRILRRTKYAQAFYFYMMQSGDTIEIERARKEINELDRGRFFLYGPEKEGTDYGMTIDDIKAEAESLRPNVLAVDYLTMLRRPGQSDLDCVNEVMPVFKSLTQRLKMRTVLLSQMSRASKTEQAKGVVGGHSKGGAVVEEQAHTEIELIKDVSRDPYKPDFIATVTKARRGASYISFSLEADVQCMCFPGGAVQVYRNKGNAGKPLFTRERPDGVKGDA